MATEAASTSSSKTNTPSKLKSNPGWTKLRTTVQISSAISSKKSNLKRQDSFITKFSTRQPEPQESNIEFCIEENKNEENEAFLRQIRNPESMKNRVINPDDGNFVLWLTILTISFLYNSWSLIVRQCFPELQNDFIKAWIFLDCVSDLIYFWDIVVQFRTGYLEQGLMVLESKKLAHHYINSVEFILDSISLMPLDFFLLSKFQRQPLFRFFRFFKIHRALRFYYVVESRTVFPNLWRVINLTHILLILAHWFGCFYYLLSEAEDFKGDWVYPLRPGEYSTLLRKYLGSVYWSTLTLTTIGDLPTPESNPEEYNSPDGLRSLPLRSLSTRLKNNKTYIGYFFTIASYLIGVFVFATIVGQVGNVITNRNANRLEFERLLDGAKTFMNHHKVPSDMKQRVLRWYDYSWSRGRIRGGGDIHTALGLLPDKLKTELALHVNLSVLKKVTIFQECQPEFLHDLVLKMKAFIYTPGDTVCRKGEVAREMFIIADGILEVLSETGRVLTLMKAGDFFGEIGILNLDGLNKRTADVRSVGYSELFSLSREDVLTAMKDHPEAQEVLQNLGRKRLMEVRSVNKKFNLLAQKLEKDSSSTSSKESFLKKVILSGRKMSNANKTKVTEKTSLLPKSSNVTTRAQEVTTLKKKKNITNPNFICTSDDLKMMKFIDGGTLKRINKHKIKRTRPSSLYQPDEISLKLEITRDIRTREYKRILNYYVRGIEKNFTDKFLRIEMELKKQNDLILQSINMKKFE